MQAIQSATSVAAQTLGQGDRLGRIQPGRFADSIATVDAPLGDITALGRIEFVMPGGRVVHE